MSEGHRPTLSYDTYTPLVVETQSYERKTACMGVCSYKGHVHVTDSGASNRTVFFLPYRVNHLHQEIILTPALQPGG